MRVLIAVASKHGSTAEIAQHIAATLREHGFEAVCTPPEAVDDLTGVDAVVIGSAVYAGHWLKQATQFAERHAAGLTSMPVWLFSSGPVGDPPEPREDPAGIGELTERLHARECRLFAGALERQRLGLGERIAVKMIGAPSGDFRDWELIERWAASIAEVLQARIDNQGRTILRRSS